MRDYLYIGHDPCQHFIVASGIEFRDIADYMTQSSGLILLNHKAEGANFDELSRFDFIEKNAIQELLSEDIYSWGDFCWVDYHGDTFPEISKQEIAELLYFGHKVEPLDKVQIPSLNNKYLFYAHDDGWFVKLYYKNWNDMAGLIESLVLSFDKDKLLKSLDKTKNAFWISGGSIESEVLTFDIDKILNKRLK